MNKEYAAMLKKVSVRQDMSEVKDSAKKLSDKMRMNGGNYTFTDANLVDALLAYIKVLEGDLSEAKDNLGIALDDDLPNAMGGGVY
jgi:hypothetical protein